MSDAAPVDVAVAPNAPPTLSVAPLQPDGSAHADRDTVHINKWLADQPAERRVEWALHHLPPVHVVSSSFGAQSAAILHMVSAQQRDIPVIFVDTGFLFAETYEFAAALVSRLSLNVCRVESVPADRFTEAEVERLQEGGLAAITHYNQVHKVEPMRRALRELNAQTWIAGLRRDQADSRKHLDFLTMQDGRWKFHCIADWTDRDVWRYLSRHHLPYHPLWEKGYVSIGDRHLTRAMLPGMNAQDTRFFGLKREFGLHD
jgi:phosphoadenosine phosphosulfate reductase